MKKWKTYRIILFTILCLMLNIGGRMLARWLEWPLWLDSMGTVLCAYVGGPVCGALVGMTGNLAYGLENNLSAAYALTSLTLGIVVGLGAKRRQFDTFYGAMQAASITIVVALAVSIGLNLLLTEGYTGNRWGDAVINYLLGKGWPRIICDFFGQLAIEFVDKSLTMTAVYLMIRLNRWRKEHIASRPRRMRQILPVLLAASLAVCAAGEARAQEAGEGTDQRMQTSFSDYVQTVYSSSNGLPCGEANDIVQTGDGVIWIGTYAGLYRYNGREFRWVDSYPSVRNVNCLYVDEEGRLWIGTNDNGLSIVIHEKVTNVIDESNGLPSNAARCIIRSSDDYYYVGTTGSMQLLRMNNGLKVAGSLPEIYYSDCLTADRNGHVAAIARGGRLFLMKTGRILSSLRLTEDQELFKCCAFAPDGTLMVGTSSNHIYTYSVEGGGFKRIAERSCEGVSSINNLHYLDDGTLFISTDSGISYIDTEGEYHRINTNDFNNSIDNMLEDYQGNLWFASSRLGLLRLARSPFRDVYGTIGMERRVVNTTACWQGCYYIGTDKGLDVVDTAFRTRIQNDLTEKLSGKRIRCMITDSEGSLWICTYGFGLWEVEASGEIHEYNAGNGGFGDQARLAVQLKDGTILAAGNTGISFIRDHQVQKTIRYESGQINSMILSLTEMDDGRILAGTDGDGIAVLEDGQVVRMLTRKDGLSSAVILRTVRDPGSGGVFLVTSNGLCYMDENEKIRELRSFPYFNNYDIWSRDGETLFVLSSAGIYIVRRDELAEDRVRTWELLDSRSGLNTSLTANSWTWYDGNGGLFLSCDTGMFVMDTENYNQDTRLYRMRMAELKLDGVSQPLTQTKSIRIGQGVSRIELRPEVLNYTVHDPVVGYYLENFEKQWTKLQQSSLASIVYTNLPAGEYAFHLAVFDSSGENILEERQMKLTKEGELYEQPVFMLYVFLLVAGVVAWAAMLVILRQRRRQEIKLNMANETVMAIANAVDAKDIRTSQHSTRVAEYSVMIAREMKCFPKWHEKKQLENLRKAAQMHDIGKIGVPDRVLNKVGRLTDEEYAEMKSHVTRGADILKDFTLVENVTEGTRYHHERYDGRGYPEGLKGREIPLYARIIGVADAFDAMTSNRVYRNQMDTDYVLKELQRGRGTQFDPEALDAFLRLIEKGEINMEELYAQRAAEIRDQERDPKVQEEVARRVEEDKKIQEKVMQGGGKTT